MKPAADYRFEFLDVLRGVAILMVMLLHFAERGMQSGDTLIHDRLWPVLQHGYLGVQLFFVISGYCITAAVYAGYNRQLSASVFLLRRCRRIFPPYWASLLLVVALGLLTITILKTPRDQVFPLAAWEWLANVFLCQGPLQARDANLVYWSLSIEVQFYIIMAISLQLGAKWGEIWLVSISLLTASLLKYEPFPLTGWIFNYWLEFACGVAAFYWITGASYFQAAPWCLLIVTALTAAGHWQTHPTWILPDGRFIPAVKTLFCAGVALALVGAYRWDKVFMKTALCRWIAAAGTISYSLYLTHVPIATRVFNLGDRITGLGGIRWLIYAGLAFLITILSGIVFFRYCEQPWLNVRPHQKSAAEPASTMKIAAASARAN